MDNGYIRLHRKLYDHWIWKDPVKFQWWVDILMTASHSGRKINIGMQLIDCNRGQCVMSLSTWASRWGVSKDKVRNFFVLLEKDGMILHDNVGRSTRITVCNYDTYQCALHDSSTMLRRKPNDTPTQTINDNKLLLSDDSSSSSDVINDNLDLNTKNAHEKKEKALTWKEDFNIYLGELRECYMKLRADRGFLEQQQKYHPNVNIQLTLEKACTTFWATEAGWANKKKSKTKNINWKTTLINSLSNPQNKVYYERQSSSSKQSGSRVSDSYKAEILRAMGVEPGT